MKTRTYVIAAILAALVIAGALAMRGEGGGMLRSLGTAIHGR